eukprot:gene24842-31230_t
MQQWELTDHEKSCDERPVKCDSCEEVMALCHFETHKADHCLVNFVECPLYRADMCSDTCTGRVKKADFAQHAVCDLELLVRMADEIVRCHDVIFSSLPSQQQSQPQKPQPQQQEQSEDRYQEIDDEDETSNYCNTSQKRPHAVSPLTDDNTAETTASKRHCAQPSTTITDAVILPDLFIGSLSRQTTDASLITMFKQFGTVLSARVVAAASKSPYAFVRMSNPDQAQLAVERADGVFLDGLKIHVMMSDWRRAGACQAWANNHSCNKGPK